MTNSNKKSEKSEYETRCKGDYESDWKIHSDYTKTFDAYEAMLLGQVYDSVSGTVDSSKITDSYTTTLAKERADRVMAKLPDGETMSVTKGDVGKAAFMDILRQKWVYPNANSQHPLAMKFNMWQLYSDVYGYMPMFYDWNVSNTGYAGPDCWLWNPRNLIPQQGRTSIQDMDYATALTWVSEKYLKEQLEDTVGEDKTEQLEEGKVTRQGEDQEEENDGWNLEAVQELLRIAEQQSTEPDAEKDTMANRTRTSSSVKKGICLATRYESGDDGEWITFAPDHGHVEVRRIKNPHKNGRIPFVIKYSQTLYDNFYGLGRFQRAKPIQFARDGLTNFYFKGIKMNLIPPLVVNANGVLKHTVDYREGAVMMETQPNSIRRLETSTAGLATFQAAQSNMTGSLLSLFGSQNASIPGADSLNPSQGKTPAAIGLYGDKEATQDGADRRNLEAAIEQLTDGFNSLIANIGTEDIPVALFQKDIEAIHKSGMTDIEEFFKSLKLDESGVVGELKIKPSSFKNVEMRFNIKPDSTAVVQKSNNLNEWKSLVGDIAKFQNIFKDDPRIEVNWTKIMDVGESLTNIPGVSDFVITKPGPSPEEIKMQEEMQKMQQELKQASEMIQQQQQQIAQSQQMQQQNQGLEQTGEQFNDPMIAEAARSLL